MKIMVVDAQEPSEPETFIIDTDVTEPPRHMMRMIQRSSHKYFEQIVNDGADAMSGLVDEDHDQAHEHAEEIFEYIGAHSKEANKYKLGDVADVYISIVRC